MKSISSILTQATGSLSGSTAFPAKSGQQWRSRISGRTSQSAAQIAAQNAFTVPIQLWTQLTPEEKSAWNDYASTCTSKGPTTQKSGRGLFITTNWIITRAAIFGLCPPQLTPPTDFSGPLGLDLTMVDWTGSTAQTTMLSIGWTNPGSPTGDGDVKLLFLSKTARRGRVASKATFVAAGESNQFGIDINPNYQLSFNNSIYSYNSGGEIQVMLASVIKGVVVPPWQGIISYPNSIP